MTRSAMMMFLACIGIGVPLLCFIMVNSPSRQTEPWTWRTIFAISLITLIAYPTLYFAGWSLCFTSEYCSTMVRNYQAQYDQELAEYKRQQALKQKSQQDRFDWAPHR